MKYVLVSPCRNEEKHVRKTLVSVAEQTLRPECWVIVDDGSTDATPHILDEYAGRYPWIKVIHLPQRRDRSFAAKVHAFNAGLKALTPFEYEVIGNLDADLSFDPDYMKFLIGKFVENPRLGVAGTPFVEDGYDSARDSFEGQNHVAGGCQLFRRNCFEEIGGYVPNKAGGIDWIAVTTARMKGWTTQSFIEKRFHHYRPLGTAGRSVLKAAFSYGEKDYYLGGSPVWEICRCAYRLSKRPYILGSLALWLGYVSAAARRMPRAVSPELMRFHRAEQMKKLRAIVSTLLRMKKVDTFAPVASTGHRI